MRLGIDFGTTRTVVAAADRGNYPVVSFQSESGDMQPWYPSLIGAHGDRLVFALDAQAHLGEPEWVFLRSLKRSLGELQPDSTVTLGGRPLPAFELLVQYLTGLRSDLVERSNLNLKSKEPLEVLIASPANANSNQRFLTLEGFRRAGFQVLGMYNEPSAAGLEYAHTHVANQWTARKEYLVVYDLGGGTFDASVIALTDHYHEVLTDEGIVRLGGDDIDAILLDLTLERFPDAPALSETGRYHLLEECRRQKENLHPNTRKIAVDLGRAFDGGGTVIVTTEEFYARCAPLVERTIEALETAVARVRHKSGLVWSDVETIYLVGGSSDLPVVGRMLRERYGRRVRRSPYPYSATAIGLAIAADNEAGYFLKERFTRHFGVWREADFGRRVVFDPVFPKDTLLPGPGDTPLVQTRSYRPAHNVACFRYLECSRLTEDGEPAGDITPWDEIVFPIDPALRAEHNDNLLEVRRTEEFSTQDVEESYSCDAHGMIRVTITDRTTAYQRKYDLHQYQGRRAAKARKRS